MANSRRLALGNSRMFVLLCILSSLIWHGLEGADFSPSSPADESKLSACAGKNVSLPWNVDLLQGEELQYIDWFFDGGPSSQRIAFFSADTGSFSPSAAFSHNVTFLPNAGLVLHHVTTGNSGNYSVGVNYLIPDGIPFGIGRSLILSIDCAY